MPQSYISQTEEILFHYNVVAYSGDEEGSLKVYKNGKLLNI